MWPTPLFPIPLPTPEISGFEDLFVKLLLLVIIVLFPAFEFMFPATFFFELFLFGFDERGREGMFFSFGMFFDFDVTRVNSDSELDSGEEKGKGEGKGKGGGGMS